MYSNYVDEVNDRTPLVCICELNRDRLTESVNVAALHAGLRDESSHHKQ